MKESDWRRFEDGGPDDDALYPILVGTHRTTASADVYLRCHRPDPKEDGWTHWMPYTAPREPDTAIKLLREAMWFVAEDAEQAGARSARILYERIETFLELEDDS